jgi:hypothetical protein
MVDKRTQTFILIVIVSLGFLYRFTLTTMNSFPPGSDIGLHESVINSILSPKPSFFYNYFHMGGGLSVTNPGYHIFTAFIITLTGLPDYIAQAAVASMFSALLILCAFMLTKLVWGELAAFVAAVLVTFSASDIVMLSWAGYPNIVALALIPLIFYLFLQPTKLPSKSYLVVVSLLVGALFLTHLFSALIFLGIALSTLALSFLSKATGFTIKTVLYWLLPILIGVVLISPYLVNVAPLYFGSQGAITGSVSVMKQAVVETRVIPTAILCLSVVPFLLFFVFSKHQKGKWFSLPALLFASSILVPLAASQGYLVGFFLDYERFLYFLALPAIICISIVMLYAANILANALGKIRASLAAVSKPVLFSVLMIACLMTPMFALPSVGASQANFFQVMTPQKYAAITWANANTASDSVFVADASYGWWLSGFAQRPTLSAVDPQYLILQREFAPAQVASNLLRADYLVDNGLLQVEQQRAFANGSSHDIYAILESSYIYPLVFSLNDTQISLLYRENSLPKEVTLGSFNQSKTQVTNNGTSASFIITRATSQFTLTETITIFQGVRFAEITFHFQNHAGANFDWLQIPFQARGFPIQYADSIGIVDNTMHQINQIVFPQNQLGNDVTMQQNPDFYQLIYNLHGASVAQITFYVGLCPFQAASQNPPADYWNNLIENNTNTYLDVVLDSPLNCFDYQAALKEWNISYVALTDKTTIARFAGDPTFRLVFENSEVAIFEVNNQ